MANRILPLTLAGIGAYLCWFAVHYFKSDVKWPTDPVKDVLQGKSLPDTTVTPSQAQSQIQAGIIADEQQQAPGSSPSAPAAGSGDTGAAGQTAQANQNTARLLTGTYGWSQAQNDTEWNDLVKLWNQESGWNNLALNPTSGAFGIAQALGHGGSGTAGKYGNQYPSKAANDGDANAQITWGLQYIQSTYGSPSSAWAHEQANNWY